MSDLRVTDVQAALRHFASVGHDVLSNPRAVLLSSQVGEEPKEYGMAIAHNLGFGYGSSGASHLSSYLLQSERPLVSEVYTGHYPQHEYDNTETYTRSVLSHSPQITKLNNEHIDDAIHDLDSSGELQPGHLWVGSYYKPRGSIPVFNFDYHPKVTPPHNDIHEALEAHRTSDVSHIGKLWESQPGVRGPIQSRDMTHEEMSRFKFKDSVNNLVHPSIPYKGLIGVADERTDKPVYYHYNPDTEQLLRVENNNG